MSRPIRYVLGLALFAGALAGCGTTSDRALTTALAALNTPPTQTPMATAAKLETCPHLTASLRPPASMPAPGTMPPGSYMAAIKHRGYLRAGVNAGLLDFGYLNPATGQIEGFEIDLVRELARAIFGDTSPKHYRLVALTVPQRIPFVQQGRVDIVVDAVTITCDRKQQVDFSTVYYGAQQEVLVPSNSNATGIAAFAHKPVCASAGSTPITVMDSLPLPDRPRAVGRTQAIDCLVALQEGQIDAISTDSSILLGFKAQDPNTRIIGTSLAPVPYGMAISKAHPDFVRFVNGVLAELRANGTWRRLYNRWLGRLAPNPILPPAQYDG
ncbi:MAG TPA: glutamate ABC transporter substrate-binding protein [Solirubrobacteraceae bacterium]|nr:glutamate ABC transporter substrate-binding protein [Solirubrobacteraceae bacterium]